MNEFQIAIVYREGGFSKRWIEYCEEKGIPYKVVNCYESDIISQLASADGLLWHFHQASLYNALIARNLLYAAELMGLKVFPDTPTCWSFDDKLAQKYQLEAVGAPLVPTYVFFDRRRAMDWIDRTSFPKVFKLRRGAGSNAVRLVRDAHEARILVKKAFRHGFKPTGWVMRNAVAKNLQAKSGFKRLGLVKKITKVPNILIDIHRAHKELGREYGYIYFQDFVPDNQFDTRITIIGNRYAFGFTRNVRKNDFRASGSGSINYDRERINSKCIKIAFDIAKKLSTQSIAFDFVIDSAGEPLIMEISYGYVPEAVYDCPGHWDNQLQWHEGHMWPQDAILITLLEQLRHTKEQAGDKNSNRVRKVN